MQRGVLQNLRVLDFGRFISAPYCGMMLADMGAEVIRVDRPGGEEDRRLGLRSHNGENFTYPSLARNKKAITLDLLRPRGLEVLRDLVAQTDVLLHNFSVQATKAMHITYEEVRSLKPNIIYTGISCYGTDGPYACRIGFDPIAQVVSGAAALTGFEGDVPLRSGVPWVDYSTGLCAALGTVLALRHRDRTGEGQEVDCSLLQTAVSYTAPMVAEALVAGTERPRLGNRAAYLGPSDLYKCLDGYVYLAAVTDAMWCSLMTLLGCVELIDDLGLQTNEQRFQQRERIDPLVRRWAARQTVEQVTAALEKAHIACGAYHSTAEVSQDRQVQARRMLEYSDLGAAGLERVPISGLPIRLSRSPAKISSRAPRVGEHNHEIYMKLLGYRNEKVALLSAEAVI
jgi:crotonobetainyl-CoA:carnitine CoA-transferase CaiB-like acyl-CoA transferase